MEYTDYNDRYVIKLHFHLPPNPDYPDLIPSNEKQRVNALVTNLRPEEPLNVEKLSCIAGQMPALHQLMRGALIHMFPEDLPNLRIIRAPNRASAGDHPVHEAWRAFTGSNCQAYKSTSQATAYRPQIVLARKRQSMIPPAALQVPWHPEELAQRETMLHPTSLYSAQVLANGQRVNEVLTPITHAGGEEVPGLWRFSAYKPDDTLYFSVVIKVTEKRQAPKRPVARKRKADDDSQDYQAPSMKRQHTFNE